VSHQPQTQGARITQLEQHIERIAAEIDASRVLMGPPNASAVSPAISIGALTARQLDIVNRLLDGARVTTIAAALYISPSTVRNHLSAVYKMAHVHSQAELIELLRPTG
jgi:DNA-binding CsgD family transcriptional regulator